MNNRGDQPTVTSSAFHWATPGRDSRDTFAVEQQTAIGDELVSYADGFHTFACEWVGNQLRFYVDDVHHATFYNDEVGYLLPTLAAPMRLVIDTAIGGDFQPPPHETTDWPQPVIVDWVRVYELAEEPGDRTFRQRRLRRKRRLAGRLAHLRQSHRRQTECARASGGGARRHTRIEDLRAGRSAAVIIPA